VLIGPECSPARIEMPLERAQTDCMRTESANVDEAARIAAPRDLRHERRHRRGIPPTADDMGEASFPASDPPATWTWDPDGRPPLRSA
jgi:hypothetical protein